jgi:hypothetical protein
MFPRLVFLVLQSKKLVQVQSFNSDPGTSRAENGFKSHRNGDGIAAALPAVPKWSAGRRLFPCVQIEETDHEGHPGLPPPPERKGRASRRGP